MPVVKFEPDPLVPGAGNATDENGRTTYVHDPVTLKRLNPSLADQVNQESTAAATAAVGAPPPVQDQRIASNEGATGTAAGASPLPAPAPSAPSPAAALVAKTDAVKAAPAAAAAAPVSGKGHALVSRLDQLPVAQSSTSTSVQKGRDAGKVQAEIDTLHKADEALDTTLRENAGKADERAQKVAEGEQALAISEQTRNYVAAQQERQRKEQIEAEIQRLNGEKDQDVNPTRLLDNMSTGKSVAMVLLAAISGAFGNMRGEGRNTFLGAIDERIAQDVQNQREQIASGRLRRNNMISYLQSQGADARQAQLAYESRVYGAAADWARAQIKAQGLQGAQLDQANAQIAQLDQARAARDAQLRESTESKYATTTNVVREAPKPNAPGSAVEDLTKKLAARKAYEEAGATEEELKRFDAATGLTVSGQSEMARKRNELSEDQGKAEAAMATINAYGQALGLTEDPETNAFREPGGVGGHFNTPRLKEDLGGLVGASKPIEAARNAAVEGLGRLQSGGVISPDEAKRFEKMLGDGQSLNQIATGLNALRTLVNSRREATRRDRAPEGPKGKPLGRVEAP